LCAALIETTRKDAPITPAGPLDQAKLAQEIRNQLQTVDRNLPEHLMPWAGDAARVVMFALNIAWQTAFHENFVRQSAQQFDIRNSFQSTVNQLSSSERLLPTELRGLLMAAAWVIFFDAPAAVRTVAASFLQSEDTDPVAPQLAAAESPEERRGVALLPWSAVAALGIVIVLLGWLLQHGLLNAYRDSVDNMLKEELNSASAAGRRGRS
jgi:hypothetical protein